MKHNLKISISKEPKVGGIVACRTVSIREKLLNRLFGCKQKITILVPGDSVETVAITEIPDGGAALEAGC
jgi:hypothetical protein